MEDKSDYPECRDCNVPMLPSKALMNTLEWGDDFGNESQEKEPPRGATISRTGESVLVDCFKCPCCGRSITR